MRTKQLCSALLREIRLMLIFWRMELGIMILSPVIFSLIPYIREFRGRSNLDPEVLVSIPWLQSHSIRYREPSIPNDRAT